MNLQYPELNFTGFNPTRDCSDNNCIDLSDKNTQIIKDLIKTPKYKYSILKSLFEFVSNITLAGFMLNNITTDNVIIYKSNGIFNKAVFKLTDNMTSVSESLIHITRSKTHTHQLKPEFRAPETHVKSMVKNTDSTELFHTNTIKSEIWSLGIVFLHLLTGDLPFVITSKSKPWIPEASKMFLNHVESKHKLPKDTCDNIRASEAVRWQTYNFFGTSDPNASPSTIKFMKDRRRCFIKELLTNATNKGLITKSDILNYTNLITSMLDPNPTFRASMAELARFFNVDMEGLANSYTITYNEFGPIGGKWTIDKDNAVNLAMDAIFKENFKHADDEIKLVALKSGMQMACAFKPNERPAVLYASVLAAVRITAELYDCHLMDNTNIEELANTYYKGLKSIVNLSITLEQYVVDFFYNVLKIPFKNHGKIFNISEEDRKTIIKTDGSSFKVRCDFF